MATAPHTASTQTHYRAALLGLLRKLRAAEQPNGRPGPALDLFVERSAEADSPFTLWHLWLWLIDERPFSWHRDRPSWHFKAYLDTPRDRPNAAPPPA